MREPREEMAGFDHSTTEFVAFVCEGARREGRGSVQCGSSGVDSSGGEEGLSWGSILKAE